MPRPTRSSPRDSTGRATACPGSAWKPSTRTGTRSPTSCGRSARTSSAGLRLVRTSGTRRYWMTRPSKRSDLHEEWAIAYLQKVVDLSIMERDAWRGAVFDQVSPGIILMKRGGGGPRSLTDLKRFKKGGCFLVG